VAAQRERARRAALEALAGESLEALAAGEEFNPFLDEGEGAPPSDETAELAASLLATSGGGEITDEEGEFNPFLQGGGDSGDGAADDQGKPFREKGSEEEPTPAKAGANKDK